MGPATSERAFINPNHTYYRTTKDIGFLPAGTIFVHDEEDTFHGSTMKGCLKLCWSPSGDCVGNSEQRICGGTVIFHYDFINKGGLFKEVKPEQTEIEVMKDQISRLEQQYNRLWEATYNKR